MTAKREKPKAPQVSLREAVGDLAMVYAIRDHLSVPDALSRLFAAYLAPLPTKRKRTKRKRGRKR